MDQLPGSGYSAYAWSTGPTTQTINITAGDNFVVTVTDANGCQEVDTYLAVVLDGPVASITSPDETELCINPPNNTSSVTINALTGAGYTFAWYCNDVLQALPSSQSFLTHTNTLVGGNVLFPVVQLFGDEVVTFTTTNPDNYQLCMRVRRTASDGSICYESICIQLPIDALLNPSPRYQVFPNPAIEEVIIQAETYWPADTEIRLLDVLGKVVKKINTGSDTVTTRKTLPLDQLAPGVYWLSLTIDGVTETKKLVVL